MRHSKDGPYICKSSTWYSRTQIYGSTPLFIGKLLEKGKVLFSIGSLIEKGNAY